MTRSGERGSRTREGANAAIGSVSNVARDDAGGTADAAVTVTFFGGQSMFLAKLGACDAVSSFCPIRVSPGTHTSTTMPSRTTARASRSLSRGAERGLFTAVA